MGLPGTLLVQILLKANKRIAYSRYAAKLLRCVIDRVVFELKQVTKLFLIQLADALSRAFSGLTELAGFSLGWICDLTFVSN